MQRAVCMHIGRAYAARNGAKAATSKQARVLAEGLSREVPLFPPSCARGISTFSAASPSTCSRASGCRCGCLQCGRSMGMLMWAGQKRWMAKGKNSKANKKDKGGSSKGSDRDGDEEEAVDFTAKIQALTKDMKDKMGDSVKHFLSEAGQLKTGRADPGILEGIKVRANDAELSLQHVAQVTTLDPRTLNVNVFDPDMVKLVDKAIRESGLDLNPQPVGNNIKVPIPKTTTEQRQKYSKMAGGLAENAKVAIRRVRQNCLDKLKKLDLPKDDMKRQEKEVQTLTEKAIKEVEDNLKKRQDDIMKA